MKVVQAIACMFLFLPLQITANSEINSANTLNGNSSNLIGDTSFLNEYKEIRRLPFFIGKVEIDMINLDYIAFVKDQKLHALYSEFTNADKSIDKAIFLYKGDKLVSAHSLKAIPGLANKGKNVSVPTNSRLNEISLLATRLKAEVTQKLLTEKLSQQEIAHNKKHAVFCANPDEQNCMPMGEIQSFQDIYVNILTVQSEHDNPWVRACVFLTDSYPDFGWIQKSSLEMLGSPILSLPKSAPVELEQYFKNKAYPEFGDERIKLNNGYYGYTEGEYSNWNWSLAAGPWQVDWDADGDLDILLLFVEQSGGNGYFNMLKAYENISGEYKYKGETFLGDRIEFENVYIERDKILVEIIGHGVFGGGCCASTPEIKYFKISDFKSE